MFQYLVLRRPIKRVIDNEGEPRGANRGIIVLVVPYRHCVKDIRWGFAAADASVGILGKIIAPFGFRKRNSLSPLSPLAIGRKRFQVGGGRRWSLFHSF